MSHSRREFLRRGAILGSAATFASGSLLRSLSAMPGGLNRNLILVEMFGGNDGTNTIIPFGLNGGSYYTEFRPNIAIAEPDVLKVAGQQVGFHPALSALKSHFDAGRVAVVHGVSYPNPSFSHEFSQRIWHTGALNGLGGEGWLARWLNLHPVPNFPCAAEVLWNLTGLTSGAEGFIPAITSIEDLEFPIDDWNWQDGANRKAAFTSIVNSLSASGGKLGSMAQTGQGLLSLIDTFEQVPELNHVGAYPEGSFATSLKLVARLLAANVGMRIFHVGLDGFDTHSDQNDGDWHGTLLARVSDGLSALHADLTALGLDQNTLIVVFSEFGRTVYENGSRGTDHGTVNPVIVFGGGVVGGFANTHPSMDPTQLSSYGELEMHADFRDVLGTVLSRWCLESSGNVQSVLHGHSFADLGFLT
jgi:uncharacterized protein (DUF1501 family)